MSAQISAEQFKRELLFLLGETFEQVNGIFLDRGTSLQETLSTISAEEASTPVGQGFATIAAQVTHVCFYLDVLDRYLKTGQNEKVDWGEVWRTVSVVTPEAWAALQARLRETYQRTREGLAAYDRWDAEHAIGGAAGLIAHTAYHLGEIRQATCTVKK